MNTQYSQLATVSFYQWLDNYILQRGHAFTNYTSQFYYQPTPVPPPGMVAYASPFKSFVWDSGVSGANILESVSGSAGTIHRGQSGMKVDFLNGRVLLNSAVGTNATISGSYSFKDLNVYFANDTQEKMVFTNKYYLNSRFGNLVTGIPPANAMVTPCIFVSNVNSQNENWAFGGLYNTKINMSLNVLAETQTQLNGVLSLLTDAKDIVFPLLPESAWPLNSYGDYKSGYNYVAMQNQYGAGNNTLFIDEVRTAKVSDYALIDQSIFLGLVDVTISKARTIH